MFGYLACLVSSGDLVAFLSCATSAGSILQLLSLVGMLIRTLILVEMAYFRLRSPGGI